MERTVQLRSRAGSLAGGPSRARRHCCAAVAFPSLCSTSSRQAECTAAGPLSHRAGQTLGPFGSARLRVCAAAAAADAPGKINASQKLAQLPITAIIDSAGNVVPEVEPGAVAWVYAIFDDKQKLQYIGFSSDLRNSLRTVLSRRTDKAYFFKALHLLALDQEEMVAVRDAWFAEVGGAPPGNKLAMERAQWQQPVDAGAISQRGKQGAAEEKCKQILEALKMRGCRESFSPNPTLLSEGMVDFLPAREVSAEELEAQREAAAVLAKQRRACKVMVDGSPKEFQVLYQRCFNTNGGAMIDCTCTFDGKETSHRIIVGKPYYEPYSMSAEDVVPVVLGLLLAEKQSLAPEEKVLSSSTFPAKYFSVSELEQWFGVEFQDLFNKMTGFSWDGDTSKFWRFNRVKDYGAMKLESAESLKAALGGWGSGGTSEQR